MAKYLVIVESPAKVKTIKKFLGSNYDVEASNGHVRDFQRVSSESMWSMILNPNTLPSEGKESFLPDCAKRRRKRIKFINTRSSVVKEKQFPGT